MSYTQIPSAVVVSLRRGVAIKDVASTGESLEAFLSRVPHIRVIEVSPTGRCVVIDGPQPIIDALKHQWGDKLHFVARAIGFTDV